MQFRVSAIGYHQVTEKVCVHKQYLKTVFLGAVNLHYFIHIKKFK